MIIIENFRIAIRALLANKLRSILTMLGIIIGVAAVVALLAIGQGATTMITSQVEGLGSNLVLVAPGRIFQQQGGAETARLYYEDYEAVLANATNMSEISPTFQTMLPVKYAEKNTNVQVTGVIPNFSEVRAYEVANGRFIKDSDRSTNAQVAVLGNQTAKDLFGNINPVGRRIKIQ